jgi:transposase InsO family protein
MPWKVSGAVDERIRFVLDYERGLYAMTELCARYGISRQNGYKWLKRYRSGGIEALKDQSRAPHSCPHRMDATTVAVLLQARETHPHWGPRKILAWLQRKRPDLRATLPAASTIGDLFQRRGLITPRRRRSSPRFDPAGALQVEEPNQVWTADYKGEFRLLSGAYCYPFTVADAYSRFLLVCRGTASSSIDFTQRALTEAFRTHGLPRAIRTDNGTPFVAHGLTGLSRLGVWWIKLGIHHQRIPPARPDQNGRHERMHRTLKAEATRPPEASFAGQQRRFDDFCHEFNQERPHEALDQQTPASHYRESPRVFPERIAQPEYPAHWERRKVSANGAIRFAGRLLFIANPLAGESLGMLEIDEDLWSIRFYDHELGRINPCTGAFSIKVSPMFPV